ncbi:MAG: hypothetical protein IKJ68_13145 [Clostridia bacterium]|nr:hypothetical protein [Clostridia bacterium]
MKKLLPLILVVVMILTFVSCGKDEPKKENTGKKVTLYGETTQEDGKALAVDFFYPENDDVTLDSKEEYINCVDINYNSKNIAVSPAIFEDTTFNENKEYAKENEETYKEFKINGYDCYGYEDFGGYWIYVHLEELSDTTNIYLVIETKLIDFTKDTPQGVAHYEDKDLKKIIESFEYHGLVDYPPAQEAK